MGIFSGIEDNFLDEQIKSLKERFKRGMGKGRTFTKHTDLRNTSNWVNKLREDIRYLDKEERIINPYGLGFVIAAISAIFTTKYDPFLANILRNKEDSREFRVLLRELVNKEGLSMDILKKRFERTNKRAQKANTQTLYSNPNRQIYIILKEKLPEFIHKL